MNGRECPYLDTINRNLLDFDFSKECSVTLSTTNVYACLVCGKFYSGRNSASPAFFHSLNDEHHVFIHLETLNIYCLPDNYEVLDRSLDDIKTVIRPTFTEDHVASIDQVYLPQLDLMKKQFVPGFIGLNNINGTTDHVTACVHALAHVPHLRDIFLLSRESSCNSDLVKKFGQLTRKIWARSAFKGHVSPHEFLQVVINAKKYSVDAEKLGHRDPQDILTWLLNALKNDLLVGPPGNDIVMRDVNKKAKVGSDQFYNPIKDLLEGILEVSTRTDASQKDAEGAMQLEEATPPIIKRVPFLHLPLELPPMPLYQSAVIPEVSLEALLLKYAGPNSNGDSLKKTTYRILKCPKYLIIYLKRNSRENRFIEEKNTTIVNFPLSGLELIEHTLGSKEHGTTKKSYKLIVNIFREATMVMGLTKADAMGMTTSSSVKGASTSYEESFYKVQLLNEANQSWYEIHDLNVKEIVPQLMFMSESCIQIWKLEDS